MGNRIIVTPVTRIEGHARIVVDVGESADSVQGHLQVWELRGFEKLLENTELFKMPQITARLCGVCPAAHHLASVMAIENGLNIRIPPQAKLLRELLYMGHILHSHALSNFVLTGPDILLGLDAEPESRNVFSLLKMNPELSRGILRLRSIGQRIVEIVGGRGVHPVTAVPGGMTKTLDTEEQDRIAGWGKDAISILEKLTPVFMEKLDLLNDLGGAVSLPFHSLGLSDGGSLNFLDGQWVVLGPDNAEERRFESEAYIEHLVEHPVDGSYMKTVHLKGDPEKSFFVGPLARLNINSSISTPKANEALSTYRASGPRHSAIDFISARLIEMLHCAERIAEISETAMPGGDIRVPASAGAGRYVGVIEAPRGLLVHDYEADEGGRVTNVNFIVATQNNYDAINHAITATARQLLPEKDDNLLTNGLEFALRCFDPCLACATHAAGRMPMEVIVCSNGVVQRTITRR